jgi:hypothetical protein
MNCARHNACVATWGRIRAFGIRWNNRNRVSPPEHQGENELAKIEQKELEGHRSEIIADVKHLVEKYRAIFDWDVPEIDQNIADKLILVEMRKALDDIERQLLV